MITFVNRFQVHGSTEEFERAFDETSAFFAAQPGFLRHRLVRHADLPGAYVNVAEWESREHFDAALKQPAFVPHATALRALATSEPNVYVPVLERDAA
ncbi:antibiotic biosynthesis monooxygenase family protein [Streptomyces huiliensis]|uniref:antibiotic biosynthesis monooxygenase family protein n=1 Tax=Streptomyces huiliensis TaxID=2876027 RepID=UPI001CBEE59E|nr:antibiotic biosynthesis monooxygenase family protein [Streptomyces huiliensis]MBZ4319369.1 antibiotic biosynthesis monooxygenase [Streptomyces huiliensis]